MTELEVSLLVILCLVFCGFMAVRQSKKTEGRSLRTKDYRHYMTDAEKEEERRIDIEYQAMLTELDKEIAEEDEDINYRGPAPPEKI